jgi:hypothetical protein
MRWCAIANKREQVFDTLYAEISADSIGLLCVRIVLCASGAAGPREGLSPLNNRFLPDTVLVIFFRPNQRTSGNVPTRLAGGHHVTVPFCPARAPPSRKA